MSGTDPESSVPLQFSLWQEVDDDKTNVIYVWDCAPKYFPSVKDHSKVVSREFVINDNTFSVDVSPAVFKQNGETRYRIPGEREEFVESAVRRIAERGKYAEWDEQTNTVQVRFSIYMLKKLLAEVGHTYSHDEITEALIILNKASITIRQHNPSEGFKNLTHSFSYLGDYASVEDDSDRYVRVTLHPLIARGILRHEFRNADAGIYFQIRNQLGRFLFRRMSALWSGAGPDSPYTPKLVSFLSQSPRGLSVEMKQNTRAFREALKSLQAAGVVKNWDEEPEKVGRSLKNMRFRIYPTQRFVDQWKASHKRFNLENKRISQGKLANLKATLKE